MSSGSISPRDVPAWMSRYRAFAALYDGESDRAAAILAASLVDEYLAAALAEIFVADKRLHKRVFDRGTLGTFAARRDVLYGLGLLTRTMYSDLEYIGQIRNRFAHAPDINSFAHDKIKNLCSYLSTASATFVSTMPGAASKPREQYLLAVGMSLVKLHFLLRDRPPASTPEDDQWATAIINWTSQQL